MHYQQHHDQVMTVNRAHLQVAETPPQSFFDAYKGKEVLKEDKARVRSQILRLKSNIQRSSGFTSNICFAMFHLGGLRFDWYVVFCNSNCTSPETTFRLLYAIVSTVLRRENQGLSGLFIYVA